MSSPPIRIQKMLRRELGSKDRKKECSFQKKRKFWRTITNKFSEILFPMIFYAKKKAIVSDSLLSINKKIKNDEKNYLDSSCFGWRGGLSVNARFDNLNLPFSIPINFTSITSPSFK